MATLIKRAKEEGTPLIDGDKVTFICKSKKTPYLQLESNFWQPIKMQALKKKYWSYTTTLPTDAYLEYCFVTKPKGKERRLPDPFNKRTIPNGMGQDNYYFDMPDVKHTKLIKREKGIEKGKVTKHVIKSGLLLSGGKRNVWLYHPPVDEPVPLLVVYDGKDYRKRARLPQIVDNLIAQEKIQPIAMAMIQHAKSMRFVEYINGEVVLGYLEYLVLPLATAELNLINIKENAGAFGVLGASMGGLMALHTGLRMPHVFGKVISQSGAYFGEAMPASYEGLADAMVKHFPKQDIHIWQDVGLYERLLNDNRRMNKLLQDKGYDVTYREYAGGHNYVSWRDILPDALVTLFGK